MCETKFYRCEHCGNIVGLIKDAGVPMKCCGENMKLMEPNTTEGSAEKHLPAVKLEGEKVKVQIGSAPHPQEEAHHIEWIYLQTDRGGHRKCLKVPGDTKCDFILSEEKPTAVYAYCNIHGLWKTVL